MAALNANSVAYTPQGRGGTVTDSGQRQNFLKIVFGDGASTYPSGGVPLTNLSKWGFPTSVQEVLLEDASSADGYLYKWSKANNTLRIYRSAGFTPAGTNDSGTPPVFTGTAVAAAPLIEVTTGFVPASNVTLYAQVRGN